MDKVVIRVRVRVIINVYSTASPPKGRRLRYSGIQLCKSIRESVVNTQRAQHEHLIPSARTETVTPQRLPMHARVSSLDPKTHGPFSARVSPISIRLFKSLTPLREEDARRLVPLIIDAVEIAYSSTSASDSLTAT